MYKWKLEFILKSGKEVTVYYECDKQHSNDVAAAILECRDNSFTGFNDEVKTKNIFIKVGEIASVSISAA